MSWYKKSKLKRPYKIYMKCPGQIEPLGIINVDQSDGETETHQAKAIAYKKFLNRISDFRQIGCVLMVALDEKKWQERLDIERSERGKEEDTVQNAWWNK